MTARGFLFGLLRTQFRGVGGDALAADVGLRARFLVTAGPDRLVPHLVGPWLVVLGYLGTGASAGPAVLFRPLILALLIRAGSIRDADPAFPALLRSCHRHSPIWRVRSSHPITAY